MLDVPGVRRISCEEYPIDNHHSRLLVVYHIVCVTQGRFKAPDVNSVLVCIC
jgi:hypothetical protein